MSTSLHRPTSICATAVFGLAVLAATHVFGQNSGATEERGTSRPTAHTYNSSEFKFSLELDKDWTIDSTPEKSDGSDRLFVATLVARGSQKDLANPALFASVEKLTDGETDSVRYLAKMEAGAKDFPLPVVVEEKTHSQLVNGVKYATFTSKLELGGTKHTGNTIYVLIRNGHLLSFHLRYANQDDRKRLEEAFSKITHD